VRPERNFPVQNILTNCDLDAESGMSLKLVYNDGQKKFFWSRSAAPAETDRW
jgi:hypothetical protein